MSKKPKIAKRPKRVFPFRVEVTLSGDSFKVHGVVDEYFKVGKRTVFVRRPFLETAGSDNHAKDRVRRSLEHFYSSVKVVPYYAREGAGTAMPVLTGMKPEQIVPFKVNVTLTGQTYSVGVKLVEYYKIGRKTVYINRPFFKARHSDADAKARVDEILAHYFPGATLAVNYKRIWPKGANPYKEPRGVIYGITHPLPRTRN